MGAPQTLAQPPQWGTGDSSSGRARVPRGQHCPPDAGGPGLPPSPAEDTPEQGRGPRQPAPRRVPGLQVPCSKGEQTGQESCHHKADPDRQTAGPCREPAAQREGSQPAGPSQREGRGQRLRPRAPSAGARLGACSGNRSTCQDDDLLQPDK